MVKGIIFAAWLLLSVSLGWCQADQAIGGDEHRSAVIVDGMNREVAVALNPHRIVCVNAAAAEVICALGSSDCIAAVTSACTMPPMLLDKEILGRSALSLEAEPIISLKPDLVIEGVPPLKEDVRDHIEQAGIPVLQYWALHVDRTLPMIDDLGLILGKEERAKDLHHFIEGYYELATARLKNLSVESQPSVYYMIMGQVSWTCGQGSDMGKSIEEAGGRNIAAGLPGNVPEVDPEWIIEQNPEIMVYHHIRQSESDAAIFSSLDELKERRDYVISQPGFDEIDAVKENRVFIIDSGIVTGPRQVVGFLHFAKWLHPQLFDDIDPEAVHKEMLERFYNVDMCGSWAYP